MKKLNNNWKSLDKVILNILSANYLLSDKSESILMNANFDNLAKGRCEVSVVKKNCNIADRILVHSDRALMELMIYSNEKTFEKLIKILTIKNLRKRKLTVFLSEGLSVNNKGYLYVNENTNVKVLKMDWHTPIF